MALGRIQVAQTDAEVAKVARTLAYALGSTRVEAATIKALHAVLLQMARLEMSDVEAFTSTKSSKANFVLWKRKVLKHARGLPLAFATYPEPTTSVVQDWTGLPLAYATYPDLTTSVDQTVAALPMPLMETVLGTHQQRSDVHDLKVSSGSSGSEHLFPELQPWGGPTPDPTPVSLPVSATPPLGSYANAAGFARVRGSHSTQQTAFANQGPVAYAVPVATALGSDGSQLLPLAEASPSITLPMQPAAPDHSNLSFPAQRALQAASEEGLFLERNLFASGFRGVTYNSNNGHGNPKAKPFSVRLRLTANQQKRVSRGSFGTAEEAALHYARLIRDEGDTYMAA